MPPDARASVAVADAAVLLPALEAAVRRAVGGAERVSVLFSGGPDSSLVAHLASRSTATRLLVVGTPRAADRSVAREAAAQLGLPIREVEIGPEDVRRGATAFGSELVGLTEPAYSVALATAIALTHAGEPKVLWGQGADELFYGYARYRTLPPEEAARTRRSDLARLIEEDNPRAERIAARVGRELRSPYLDPEFRGCVERLGVPPPGEGPSKPVLRSLARAAGLPASICDRPKRAFQYGSGVRREVEREGRSGPSRA